MNDPLALIVDDDQKEELNVEGPSYAPPDARVDKFVGGSSGQTPDRSTGLAVKDKKKPEGIGINSLADDLSDWRPKGKDEQLAVEQQREQATVADDLAKARAELEDLIAQQGQSRNAEDEKYNEALLEESLQKLDELQTRQQQVESRSTNTKKPKKSRLDSFTATLQDSLGADIRVLTQKLPKAIKGSWLQGRKDAKFMKVQKEINEFRHSKGLPEIPVGKMREKAGSKKNISVRESDDAFHGRFMQQVQEAQGLGMGTPKGLDAAMGAHDRYKQYREKNAGFEI